MQQTKLIFIKQKNGCIKMIKKYENIVRYSIIDIHFNKRKKKKASSENCRDEEDGQMRLRYIIWKLWSNS